MTGGPKLGPDLASEVAILGSKAAALNGSHAAENTPNSREC
jgi:hypothetical protein